MDLLDYFGRKPKPGPRALRDATIAERHTPTCLSDFMGNYKQIKEMDQWFSGLDTQKKSGLLVSGPTGCGKTTLVSLMCTKYGKNAHVMDSSHKRTRNELNAFFKRVKRFTTHGIIVLDDLDTLINKSDSVSMSELAKWAMEEHSVHVIYVTNSIYINKLTAISSVCTTIHIEYPTTSTLFTKCLAIAESESIVLSDTNLLQLKQMINANKDPRVVINGLSLLDVVHGSTKDIHMDIYNTYRLLLDADTDLDTKLRYFSVDSGTIPIIFHENYVDFVHSLSDEIMANISDSMSIADMYHKNMFTSTSTLCVETYGCLSSVFPSLYTHPDIKKDKVYKSPRFGLIWTKQSAMYQKSKYWSRFQEHYTCPITHDNIGYMNDIYKHMIKDYTSKKTEAKKERIRSFLNLYDIRTAQHAELAFDMYNSYNVQLESKTITKKSFIQMIKTCLD